MKIKDVIAGVGFLLMFIGGSCDLSYSDIRAVAAIIITGCLLVWFGGKDYEAEDDTY